MEAILFIAGIFFGIVISIIWVRAYRVGTLRIDQSDPQDGPFMFLELDKGMGNIASKKNVILKVSLENYISHE